VNKEAEATGPSLFLQFEAVSRKEGNGKLELCHKGFFERGLS